eukprot:9130289-Pyramimonas_sp.AAC.1
MNRPSQPETILRAWQLTRLLHDPQRTSLHEVAELCFRMVLPAAESDAMAARLANCMPKCLRHSVLLRLGYLEILYQREFKSTKFSRHWQADSSPQPPYNFYPVLEDRLAWPDTSSCSQLLSMDCNAVHSSRSLPLSTLGQGAA